MRLLRQNSTNETFPNIKSFGVALFHIPFLCKRSEKLQSFQCYIPEMMMKLHRVVDDANEEKDKELSSSFRQLSYFPPPIYSHLTNHSTHRHPNHFLLLRIFPRQPRRLLGTLRSIHICVPRQDKRGD